jgi:hypothetical protein
MIDMVIAFILAWISSISGVALGGYLVFKTKREHYESLWSPGGQMGESFNIDDDLSDVPQHASAATIPEPVERANDLFMDQFAEKIAERGN